MARPTIRYTGSTWAVLKGSERLMRFRIGTISPCFALAIALGPVLLRAYSEDAPIHYSQTPSHDAVARLQERLDRGQATLRYDDERGYLDSLLALLKAPPSSQGLVFSKTSLQWDFINPRKPRAIYFNDDTYVGYVRGAPLLELTAIDPHLGAVFYTLRQERAEKPTFVRHGYDCLQCHETPNTESVPGLLVRSVFADMDGSPIQSGGAFVTTDQSPLRERWGGWYITGALGNQRHMGNTTYDDGEHPDDGDVAWRTHLTRIPGRVKPSAYPADTSDAVAAMVLAHQLHVHNLLTSTAYYIRTTRYVEAERAKAAGLPPAPPSAASEQRINGVCEILVRALLFSGETPLEDRVAGADAFASDFTARGPRDAAGRSLRDFDLAHRLFKYPCSYLIYSEQFDALPAEARQRVFFRLRQILTGRDDSRYYAHLTSDDRAAILSILRQTRRDLPADWQADLPANSRQTEAHAPQR